MYCSFVICFLDRLIDTQIRSNQSLSRVWFFATPWIAARQVSLSITNSRSSLRLMSIESVMPSSHLILCRPLLLLPPIPPSIRVFFFFKFYFIFKLYKIVLVLPNIKMNPPQVYMCSPSWNLLLPPSPYHPSGLSQCTSPKHPVSCIEPGLATRFIHDILHVSESFPMSQLFA